MVSKGTYHYDREVPSFSYIYNFFFLQALNPPKEMENLSEFFLKAPFNTLSFVGLLMGECFSCFILLYTSQPTTPFLVDNYLSRPFSLETRLSILPISMALLISTSPFQVPFVFLSTPLSQPVLSTLLILIMILSY